MLQLLRPAPGSAVPADLRRRDAAGRGADARRALRMSVSRLCCATAPPMRRRAARVIRQWPPPAARAAEPPHSRMPRRRRSPPGSRSSEARTPRPTLTSRTSAASARPAHVGRISSERLPGTRPSAPVTGATGDVRRCGRTIQRGAAPRRRQSASPCARRRKKGLGHRKDRHRSSPLLLEVVLHGDGREHLLDDGDEGLHDAVPPRRGGGERPAVPGVQGLAQFGGRQQVGEVLLVVLDDDGQLLGDQAVGEQVDLHVLEGREVVLEHRLARVGHEHHRVGAGQHHPAGGVVLDLAGDRVELDLEIVAGDRPQAEGKEVEEERAVLRGVERDEPVVARRWRRWMRSRLVVLPLTRARSDHLTLMVRSAKLNWTMGRS